MSTEQNAKRYFLGLVSESDKVGRSDSDAVRLFWLVRLLSDFSREKSSIIALFAFMTSYIAVTSNKLC